MIAVLVPRLGQPSEPFINRHIYGMSELNPIVFTLGLGERPVDIPTVVVISQNIMADMLSRLIGRACIIWDKHLMGRDYIWEAKCFGAGQRLARSGLSENRSR